MYILGIQVYCPTTSYSLQVSVHNNQKARFKDENRIRNPTKTHKKLDIDGNEESSRVIISLTNAASAHLGVREKEGGGKRGREETPPPIVVLCKGTPCAAHGTHPATPSKRGKHAKLNRSQKESVENQAFSSARILASKSRHTTQKNARPETQERALPITQPHSLCEQDKAPSRDHLRPPCPHLHYQPPSWALRDPS